MIYVQSVATAKNAEKMCLYALSEVYRRNRRRFRLTVTVAPLKTESQSEKSAYFTPLQGKRKKKKDCRYTRASAGVKHIDPNLESASIPAVCVCRSVEKTGKAHISRHHREKGKEERTTTNNGLMTSTKCAENENSAKYMKISEQLSSPDQTNKVTNT